MHTIKQTPRMQTGGKAPRRPVKRARKVRSEDSKSGQKDLERAETLKKLKMENDGQAKEIEHLKEKVQALEGKISRHGEEVRKLLKSK